MPHENDLVRVLGQYGIQHIRDALLANSILVDFQDVFSVPLDEFGENRFITLARVNPLSNELGNEVRHSTAM